MAGPAKKANVTLPPAFAAQAGKGRPKGVTNKNTAALKDMILKALDQAGGVEYLVSQADKNPGPFLALVGKVLPMTVSGEDGAAVQIEMIRRVVVQPYGG